MLSCSSTGCSCLPILVVFINLTTWCHFNEVAIEGKVNLFSFSLWKITNLSFISWGKKALTWGKHNSPCLLLTAWLQLNSSWWNTTLKILILTKHAYISETKNVMQNIILKILRCHNQVFDRTITNWLHKL